MSAPCLFLGEVVHVRARPRRHRLRYRVFSMLLDIGRLEDLARDCRLFSIDRFNLFSFHHRDHADGAGGLRAWVDAQLARVGIEIEGGSVELLCYPRILGFVFNPLSIYFCRNADGHLAAILYEVHNTFGERHVYLAPVAKDATSPIRQSCRKMFHVSPFIGMDARYDFRLAAEDEDMVVTIRETDAVGHLLTASFIGRRVALDDRALASAFVRYPLMTLKVVAGIHWEAFRIWRKGARFHAKPAPPCEAVTIVGE